MDIEALERSVVFDDDWRRYEQQFMEMRAEAAKASDIDAKLLSLMPRPQPGQPTARRNLQSWDLSTRGTSVPVPPYRLEDKPDGAEWDTEVRTGILTSTLPREAVLSVTLAMQRLHPRRATRVRLDELFTFFLV